MTGKEVISKLYNQGITVSIDDRKIKLSGCVTNEHRNLVKANKAAVIAELAPEATPEPEEEFLTDAQQIETLVSWGYERELAELIIWAWVNDHRWPISPFSLSNGRVIEKPKEFYINEIGLSIADSANATLTRDELKAVLLDLKNIVDNELVPV